MEVKFIKLHDDAKEPLKATDGSACFDLFALENGKIFGGRALKIRTGLAFEIPKDHVMLVFSRSGMGFNEAVRLSNCVGVIDSDYRGEVMVKLQSDSDFNVFIDQSQRIAQFMIIPVPTIELKEVFKLDETQRGTGGLGSTG